MSQKDTTKSIIALIVVFVLYFMLNSGSEIFSVVMFDEGGNPVHTQSLQRIFGVELVQSLNGDSLNGHSVLMQSAYEAEADESLAVFRAVTTSPFGINSVLKYIDVYKNDKLVYRHTSNKVMGPGESFIYKTDEIDLTGEITQSNLILIQFIYEDASGIQEFVDYKYEYLFLVECISDSNCKGLLDVCDVDNVARLSIDPDESFCTRLCDDHRDCFDGQLCIQGYCGY